MNNLGVATNELVSKLIVGYCQGAFVLQICDLVLADAIRQGFDIRREHGRRCCCRRYQAVEHRYSLRHGSISLLAEALKVVENARCAYGMSRRISREDILLQILV